MFEVKSRFQRNGIVTILSCVKTSKELPVFSIRINHPQFDIYYDYFETMNEVETFKKRFRNVIDLTN